MTPAAIIALRTALGMTQEQLARRLRVGQNTVCRWEQGLRRPGGPAVLMLEALRDTLPAKRRKA